ncbi:MAG: hypothetical protein FJ086_04125 [Deltaproteobacteria bacterium]|nr:hypothetical protein [Deltaproteobacteria bacterium]
MSHRRLAWSVVPCALLAAACRGPVQVGPSFNTLPVPPGERLQVAFQPPVGGELVERSLTVRTESAWEEGKQGPARSSRVELVTALGWAARAEGGWVLNQRVRNVKAEVDGKPVEDPLLVLATSFPVVLRFASDGAFVELLNRDAVREAVEAAFPDPEQRRAVLEFFTPEAVEEQARLEWDGRHGGLFGRPLEAAHPLYAVEVTAVGPLPLAYAVERRLRGTAETPWGRALVLEQACVQAADKAVDPAGWTAAWEARGKPALDPSLTCEGEQVLGLAPFVPVKSRLLLRARPADAQGRVAGELTWERTQVLAAPAEQAGAL